MSDFDKQMATFFKELNAIDLQFSPSKATLAKFFVAALAANILGYASLIGLGVVAKTNRYLKENDNG